MIYDHLKLSDVDTYSAQYISSTKQQLHQQMGEFGAIVHASKSHECLSV